MSGEQQSIIIELEKPLSVVGEVRASGTGGLLTGESVEAFIADEELYIGGSCQDGQYRIPNVPPGRHRLVVGAYGYQTAELVVDVARHDQTDEFRADVTLTDGPRGRITGRVVDQSNHGVADAMVWLTGAPRGTLTDAQGSYTLDRIASGTAYTVNAQAEDYTLASVELAPLAAGEVRPIEPFRLPRSIGSSRASTSKRQHTPSARQRREQVRCRRYRLARALGSSAGLWVCHITGLPDRLAFRSMRCLCGWRGGRSSRAGSPQRSA